MGLTREERAEAARLVAGAVAAQAALDDALAAHKKATADLAAARAENEKALAAYREFAARARFAPVVNGFVAVDTGGRVELRPLQAVDEPAPAVPTHPTPAPVQPKPNQGPSKKGQK